MNQATDTGGRHGIGLAARLRSPRVLAWIASLVRLGLLAALLVAARPPAQRYDEVAGVGWVPSPVTGHWYAIAGPQLPWDEAQELAEQWGGYLACLETGAESAWLDEQMLTFPTRGVWLGAREVGGEGHWEWVNGAPFAYTHWYEGEPNNDAGLTDNRLTAYDDGQWNDSEPFTFSGQREDHWPIIHALIERETDPYGWRDEHRLRATALHGLAAVTALSLLASAMAFLGVGQRMVRFGPTPGWRPRLAAVLENLPPAGWLALALLLACAAWWAGVRPRPARPDEPGWVFCELTGHWYGKLPTFWSWTEARTRALALGVDLVVIETAAENEWLARVVVVAEGGGAYIGLREVGGEGDWRWVDGTRPGYGAWEPGMPNNQDDGAAPNNVAHIWGHHDQRRFDSNDGMGERHGLWNDLPEPLPSNFPDELRPGYALLERATPPHQPGPVSRALGVVLLALAGLAAMAAVAVDLKRRPAMPF